MGNGANAQLLVVAEPRQELSKFNASLLLAILWLKPWIATHFLAPQVSFLPSFSPIKII